MASPFLTPSINQMPQITIQFCGHPDHGLDAIDNELAEYLRGMLSSAPAPAPNVSMEQWETLDAVLTLHYIHPFLYCRAVRLPDNCHPPATVMASWRDRFLKSRARLMRLEIQLAEILNTFRENHIRLLVLKGPAIGNTVYDDPAARPFADLDLLVAPENMVAARNLLKKSGYHWLGNRYELSQDFYYEESFIPHAGGMFGIELHWALDGFSRIGRKEHVDQLFDRAITVKSGNLTFEALDPVDAMIHRALKNVYHKDKEMRLIWLVDVALLAQRISEAGLWPVLQERSVAWHARLALELSLLVAKEWTAPDLPEGFEDFAAWPHPSEAEIILWRHADSRHDSLMAYIGFYLRSSKKPLEKIASLAHLLFPSPAYMQVAYPPARGIRLPLSYARRLWAWLNKSRS
jgi:hypothetical protein